MLCGLVYDVIDRLLTRELNLNNNDGDSYEKVT